MQATDRAAAIVEIKSTIKKATIEIKLEYTQGHSKRCKSFEQNPISFMIAQCDNKAEMLRESVERGEITYKIEYYRAYTFL